MAKKFYCATEQYPGVKFPVEAMDNLHLYRDTPDWFSKDLANHSIVKKELPQTDNEKILGLPGETVFIIEEHLCPESEPGSLWWFPATSILLRDANGKYFRCRKEEFETIFFDYSEYDYVEKFISKFLKDPRDLSTKLHALVDILVTKINETK